MGAGEGRYPLWCAHRLWDSEGVHKADAPGHGKWLYYTAVGRRQARS